MISDDIAAAQAAALEAVRKVFEQLVAGIPGYDTHPHHTPVAGSGRDGRGAGGKR